MSRVFENVFRTLTYPQLNFVLFFFGLHGSIFLFQLLHFLLVNLDAKCQVYDSLGIGLEISRHVFLKVLQYKWN